MKSVVFLIQCPDRKGLVARISTFFYERDFNIVHCQQFTDVAAGQYFMRLKLDLDSSPYARRALEEEFGAFAETLDLEWEAHYSDYIHKVAILATKAPHCLYDLLYRQQCGELPCEIPLVIANHPDLEPVADKFRTPFFCLPVTPETKPQQEAQILSLLRQHHIDAVVLARYMQVLSDRFIEHYPNRIINIHHAVLPAFQGANPYQRAFDRGVKMIGATGHYVTADLDKGPIIEQDVQRVTHEHTVEDLRQVGADVERLVLARAVKAHLEHRIIVTGNRTIVFSSGV